VLSYLKPLAEAVLGAPAMQRIAQLGAWYDENQIRFTFWVFY